MKTKWLVISRTGENGLGEIVDEIYASTLSEVQRIHSPNDFIFLPYDKILRVVAHAS